MNSIDIITEESIKAYMNTKVFGQNLLFLEEIDSTNVEIKRQAVQGAGHGFLVIAEQQTMGKGRQGRSWTSPKGTGIWMSLLLRPKQLQPQRASMLTLVAALSVAAAIKEVTGLESWIKWPNDIVVGNKKVCGILTEMSSEADRIHYVVVGIGINVNTREFPMEIMETATSLLLEKGKLFDDDQVKADMKVFNRSLLAAKVLEHLEPNYERFLQNGDMGFLLEEYNKMLINRHRQVKIVGGREELTGIAKGINEQGELLIETKDGLIEICSGEVSVRGLYGYV